MSTGILFFLYWGLAFVTLCAAVAALNFFYRFVYSNLELHGLGTEITIAVVASAVQGAGFWVSSYFFHGDPFRCLTIPAIAVALIYLVAHLPNWGGLETSGIAGFQAAIIIAGMLLLAGQFQFALAVVVTVAIILSLIAHSARSA